MTKEPVEQAVEAPPLPEDTCRFCGEHIGHGPIETHIGVCEKPACQQRMKTVGKRKARRYTKGRRR